MQSSNDHTRFDVTAIESRFLNAWQSESSRPQLDEFVGGLDDADLEEVLQALIPIDIQYRFQAGENVDASTYKGFGQVAREIAEELFAVYTPDTPAGILATKHGSSAKNLLGDSDSWDPQVSENAPKNLITDRYRMLHKIGQGGMGAVWMAQQEKPMRRKVAIKIIGKSLDSEEALGRFAAERQALAMMDHPNIAKVLDAGYTEDDRPFFAMELVKGIPITQYCSDHKLTIEKRLELMVQVCEAVQHAHQKGIIHRDLKPSNILVSYHEGEPLPKVIDFGLAKALEGNARLTEESIVTEFGRVVGTLQYMSPEQASSDELDVDTRTDIYSLGVVLYQLLIDIVPLEKDTLSGKSLIQIVELIRDMDVARPSKRLHEDPDLLQTVCHERKTDANQLTRKLEGELDWIVLKSLQRDRIDRYQTAIGLEMDLNRFLENEPVEARPLSKAYLFRKFLGKHRRLVATFFAVGLILAGSTLFSLISWQNERQAKAEETLAKKGAEELALQLEEDFGLFNEFFESADLKKGAKKYMTAFDMVNKAANELKERSGEFRPSTVARFSKLFADRFVGLSQYEKAMEFADYAHKNYVELGEVELANKALLTFVSANAEFQKSLSNEEKAPRKLKRKTDELYESIVAVDEAGGLTKAKYTKAVYYFVAFKEWKKKHPDKLDWVVDGDSLIDESIGLFHEVIQRYESEGDRIQKFKSQINLANALLKRGRNEDVQNSIQLSERCIAEFDSKSVEEDQLCLKARNNLAEALAKNGNYSEAIKEFRDVIAIKKKHYYAWHDGLSISVKLLYELLVETGQDVEAKELVNSALNDIRVDRKMLYSPQYEQIEQYRDMLQAKLVENE